MRYSTPELIPMGRADKIIASSLAKGVIPIESLTGPDLLTPAPAYAADE